MRAALSAHPHLRPPPAPFHLTSLNGALFSTAFSPPFKQVFGSYCMPGTALSAEDPDRYKAGPVARGCQCFRRGEQGFEEGRQPQLWAEQRL